MRSLTLALLLSALLLPQAAADAVVWFVDGRTMEVAEVSFQGDLATLRLEGGSQIRVAATRIERFYTVLPAAIQPAPVDVLRRATDRRWRQLAGPYAATIERVAQRHGLDPRLLAAIAEAESGFNASAVSHKGAQGLLQLMPATAQRFGVADSFDPDQNVEGGAQYLRWLLDRFSGNKELAIAGYNAGEGAVDRHSGVPPFPETERYVARVMTRFQDLQALPAPLQ